MTDSLFNDLFQELPPSYAITNSQIRSYYHSLYVKLLDYYNSKDFLKINKLLECSTGKNVIPYLKLQYSEDDSSDDTLLTELAYLLYKIITIYPVKYYKTQYLASNFLYIFLETNNFIKNFTIEWKPFYKVMKYYLNQKKFYTPNKRIGELYLCFMKLVTQLNRYFSDEIDEVKNGISIKTTTTEQLMKKFLPFNQISDLDCFLPYHKSRYALYFDYLLDYAKTGPDMIFTVLTLLARTIESNIEVDFSSLLPIIKEIMASKIIEPYNNVNNMILDSIASNLCALFISPPTRYKIIEILENLSPKLKCLCHPSRSGASHIRSFIRKIVIFLNAKIKAISQKIPKKRFYNASEDISPSKEELHKLLTITSEINIINIAGIVEEGQVISEIELDPSLIDRYFEIGFQCINLVEALNVAKAGWIILVDLIVAIEENEVLQNNFETLFLLATQNLHHFDQQRIIAQFINICLFKVPFNKETTVKGLEYVNFSELSVSYFTNLISILKSLPLTDQELIQIDNKFVGTIKLTVTTMFRNCEKSVFAELLPIFCSFASDESLASCMFVIGFFISRYCYFADSEQSQKVVKSFKRQLDITTQNNMNVLRYLLNIYSLAFICSYWTVDATKQVLDFLLQYTKSENEKVRKIAWEAFSYSAAFVLENYDIHVSLKKGIMKNNVLEYASLNDFEITCDSNFDISNLIFEFINPVFDKILTLKDPIEINKLLNETIPHIKEVIIQFITYSEGSMDSNNVNEIFIGPINFVSEFIKKTFPLKDNLIKCANRIIKEFPENENLIRKILKNTNLVVLKYLKNIDFIKKYVKPNKYSEPKYNSAFLYYLIKWTRYQRIEFLLPPLNDEFKQLLTNVINLIFSKSKFIQETSICFLSNVTKYYSPFIYPIIADKIFNEINSISYPQLISFVSQLPMENILLNNDKLFCEILIYLIKNFELNDQQTLNTLKQVMDFFSLIALPSEATQEYSDLLETIEKNYLYKYPSNRSYNAVLIKIIFICLKHVNDINDTILEYVIKNITHFDDYISVIACHCFSGIMERRKNYTKEKITVKEYPTSFPNILEQVSIEFKENGVYIPNLSLNNDENNQTNDDINENSHSIDSDPSNSIDVNINSIQNEEIKQVFHSFKNIKIEWKNDEFLESKYFKTFNVNSTKMYKESFKLKKYEFTENQMLIKNIKSFCAGSMISLNEKNDDNGIPYQEIWHKYALTVGPYCIRKLNHLCIEYLSQYYEVNSLFTSRILSDMIIGFGNGICYWSPNDRIEFFKLVVLPVIFIISSNPKTANYAVEIISILSQKNSPYCFAPLIKALFVFAPNGPNLPVINRVLTSLLIQQVSFKPFFYFEMIAQLTNKFIQPFIEKFDEYNSNEVDQMIFLLFSFLESVCESEISLNSNEIEPKQNIVLKIFDDILEKPIDNNDVKRNLIRSLIYSFGEFNFLRMNAQLLIVNLFHKHFHKIINLMNNSNLKEEEKFLTSINSYIQNKIFFYYDDLEYQLISSLIKEMINSSLKIQLFLTECVNTNLEKNILNIQKNDYSKYEDLLLEYNRYVIEKSPSKQLQLNIAKILGIFEVRNCTFKQDLNDIDSSMLKAGSILLNSYLFDHVDDMVVKAFDFMDKNYTANNSKYREFYENISEIFIHNHSNHVINESEALICQYNRTSIPSYFS